MGGIITIAVADAFSDAVGIHISEESEKRHTEREIWESTLSKFFFKFIFALAFIYHCSRAEGKPMESGGRAPGYSSIGYYLRVPRFGLSKNASTRFSSLHTAKMGFL